MLSKQAWSMKESSWKTEEVTEKLIKN